MSLIDGFAINCGNYKRVITLKDGVYTIGCFDETKEQAVKAIKLKYNSKGQEDYLKKIDDCEDMKWLTDEIHKQLKDDESWEVREVVAMYSDKYHSQFINDTHWRVREAVANFKRRNK